MKKIRKISVYWMLIFSLVSVIEERKVFSDFKVSGSQKVDEYRHKGWEGN